jgi:hypothetical protein
MYKIQDTEYNTILLFPHEVVHQSVIYCVHEAEVDLIINDNVLLELVVNHKASFIIICELVHVNDALQLHIIHHVHIIFVAVPFTPFPLLSFAFQSR